MDAMNPTARAALIASMQSCEQTPGMTVLQHGEMVSDFFGDLIGHIRNGAVLRHQWRLPAWISDPVLLRDLPSDEIMGEYHLFHDCGKPVCRTLDDDGRQHFPDHAAVSQRIWTAAGGGSAIGDLIGMDMDVHVLKGDDIAEFSAKPQVCALLLTALTEIHANASMFGGIESVSFKMKWKHLDKRGRAILRMIAERETMPMAA